MSRADYGVPQLFVVDRNYRPLLLPAGARVVNVMLPFRRESSEDRTEVEMRARQMVVDAYEAEWGPLQWDLSSIHVAHTTAQVLVELWVAP